MPSEKEPERLQSYLGEVRAGLRDLAAAEVDEILRELRSHVLDRTGGDFADARVTEALALLGDPRQIASANLCARAAGCSRRPAAGTLSRFASLGPRGLAALLVSLAGYGFAAVWLLTALAKPVWPDRVGLWALVDPGDDLSFSLGRQPLGIAGHDLLGWWIVPLGLAVGLGVAWITYRRDLRALRRMTSRWRGLARSAS